MKIKIPVECQNGHKANWYISIVGLSTKVEGVPMEEKCDCPKWDFGHGYHAVGSPVVVED